MYPCVRDVIRERHELEVEPICGYGCVKHGRTGRDKVDELVAKQVRWNQAGGALGWTLEETALGDAGSVCQGSLDCRECTLERV